MYDEFGVAVVLNLRILIAWTNNLTFGATFSGTEEIVGQTVHGTQISYANTSPNYYACYKYTSCEKYSHTFVWTQFGLQPI